LKGKAAGAMLGFVAGTIDAGLMMMQGLSMDANLSALAHWTIAGFFIAAIRIELDTEMAGVWKGLLVSLLMLIPIGILVGWKQPLDLVPMLASSIILGAGLGLAIEALAQ